LRAIARCSWKNKSVQRAIVTGAQGFLGRHIVHGLRQRGVHVTTLGRQPTAEASHVAMGDAPWCPAHLARIIEAAEPDAIFHLVGSPVGSPAELERLNLGVATAVMQALRDAHAHPLLVCCGSATEYGAAIVDGVPVCETTRCAPISPYGVAKLAQTNATLAFGEATGTPVLIARIFNPIGPDMPAHLALGNFARQLAALRTPHGTLQSGNINVFRDFIDIDHVVTMLWHLAHNPAARGPVNICSGEATELRKLVEILIDVSGKKITIETISSRLRPGELGVVLGSTALLGRLGAGPPKTDYPDVVARVWKAAKSVSAASHDRQ
jgi:GDP-4-dehydro-6-deoxy-D-mannose reductase